MRIVMLESREGTVAQGNVKSGRKGKRTILQYCSVCKKEFQMPVVEEADEVIWLKCPGCQGYLPYMTEEAERYPKSGEEKTGDETEPVDLAPEDIDQERAIEYHETDEYRVGDIIYHRSWNDYGKVITKEVLPGNRKTIQVQFVTQGRIRLLEGVPKRHVS
jgi:hypothetical protein